MNYHRSIRDSLVCKLHPANMQIASPGLLSAVSYLLGERYYDPYIRGMFITVSAHDHDKLWIRRSDEDYCKLFCYRWELVHDILELAMHAQLTSAERHYLLTRIP